MTDKRIGAGIKTGWVAVPRDGETGFEAYEARPDRPNGHVLIMLQEIFGINASIRASADRMAGEGYHVLAPDLFWRFEPHIELAYDKEGMQRAFDLLAKFDEPAAIDDIAATMSLARGTVPGARGFHLVGFCLGGKLAVMAAAKTHPDSAVSFYGVGVEKDIGSLKKARCPLLLHYGGKDRFVPPEAVEAVRAAARECSDVEIHLYPEADHGFFSPGRPAHDPEASRVAWERSVALFERAADE